MNDRVQVIIDKLLMSIPEFARQIGMSDDNVYNIVKNRLPVSPNFKNKLFRAFPQINQDWFETGNGEMFLWKAEEKEVIYKSKCKQCQEKDEIIKILKQDRENDRKLYEGRIADLQKTIQMIEKYFGK